MTNPFFSGRIPAQLGEKIDEHLRTTGETRSELLIRLLRAEVSDNKPDNDNKTDNIIADLLQRVTKLEQIIIDNKLDNKASEAKTTRTRNTKSKPVTDTTTTDSKG
jgi:metal-responsive CopG/Arc/MetJ family transcriptional regulator